MRMFSSGQNSRMNDVDPKIPMLTGSTRADWKRYRRAVESWYVSQTAESDPAKLAVIQKGAGPGFYRNLLAADPDVAALVEVQDPRNDASATGVTDLLGLLEKSRFSESKLRELPRLLRHFYRGGLKFRSGGDEPMRLFHR